MTASPANRWTVLAVICAALVVVIIDVTVLHVAAPSIAEDLDTTSVQLLWIVDIYPLVVAPLLVASGTLGDRFGRKRLLVWGLVAFGAASALAAFAPNAGVLIAARALQGLGGAFILPATMAIIRDVFRDREERVKAVGIWSAVLAGGAAVGPLVGGFVVEHWGWGAVFLINVPVIAAVLPFAIRLLPESKAATPPPWDTIAVLLAALGVLGFALGVKEGARQGFTDPVAITALVVGVLSGVTFVRRQLGRPMPLLNVRLFADRTFSVAVGCVLLSMFGLVGLELLFAQYLQLVLGLAPLDAAVRLMPLMVSTIAGSLFAARLLRRFGTRTVIVTGLGITALALIPMLLLGTSDVYVLMWPPFVAMGFALEVALVAANDTIISAVPADQAGGAAAIEETAYELGGGLGVAVLGSIVASVYTATLGSVSGVHPSSMATARESITGAVDVAAALPATIADRLMTAADDAFLHGFHVTIGLSALFIGAMAIAAAVVLRDRRTTS